MSVDSDESALKEQSDLGLFCSPICHINILAQYLIIVSEFAFNIPPTAKVIWRPGHTDSL